METFTPEQVQKKAVKESSSLSLNLTKVFLWMVLGLAVSGVVAFFLPDLLILMANSFNWSAEVLGYVYIGLIVASFVMMIPITILLSLKAWRPKSVLMVIGYLFYSVLMGILLSSIFVTILSVSSSSSEFLQTVGVSFFITAGAFLLMAFFGFIMKKSASMLIPILLAFFSGVLVISLVNLFLHSELIYWITDFVIFGLILIITAIDINRVKNIAQNGGFSSENNLTIYCAFTLYADFINILLRVLYYVMIARSRKK